MNLASSQMQQLIWSMLYDLVIHIYCQMLAGTCQELRPFKFYSIQQFEYKQLISKSKYLVGLYMHIESKIDLVIKQIPYVQKQVQILKKIQKIKSSSIVPIVGACILRSKVGWGEALRLKNNDTKDQRKEYTSLLIFMEKYDMNLHQYVRVRRKNMTPFKQQEIKNFISQMLEVFSLLQKAGIAHRDIKPENILMSKGTFYVCDFQDAVDIGQKQKWSCELSTVEYSSPQYLRHIRHPKDKYFDPFKLDMYSFGLTLLYMCSMGKFSLQERTNYIYESSERSHADFIKQQRTKWIKSQRQLKPFNNIIKIALEEDEYKRDDFITLTIKTELKNDVQRTSSVSDDNSNNSKSSSNLKQKKLKKLLKGKRQLQLKYRQVKVYGVLSSLMIILFILVCLL